MTEFRKFLLRGNVIDLAVAVIIGGAFGAVVTSFVKDLLTPLIAAIGGQRDFAALTFTLHGSVFRYGLFINALIAFLLVALVLFFAVVRPINALNEHYRTRPSPDPTTRKCPLCLSEIPIAATRCAFCTSEVATAA